MSLPSIHAALDEPFFTVDGTGSLVEWNHVVAELVDPGTGASGTTPTLATLLAPADAERVRRGVEAARAGERSTVRATLATPDGRAPHDLRVVPVADDDPDADGTAALVAGRRLDADADADVDVDADTGADADAGRDTDTGADADAGRDTDAGTGADAGRDTDTGTGADGGTDADADAGAAGRGDVGDADASRSTDLLDRVTDAFFAVDREWRVTYANERGRELLSRAMGDVPPEEITGRHLWEEIPDAVGTTFHEQYRRAMETREPASFEAEYGPLDAWFDVRAYPSETGLSVYFHDVTERRRRREALADRERVLRRLYDIVADRERSFEEQLDALLALGREVLGTRHGTLSSVEDGEYVVEAMHSATDELEPGDTFPLPTTICERTVTDEETLVLDDIARDDAEFGCRDAVVALDVRCYLGAPVFVDGDVYGTFCFYGDDPAGEFSEWHVTLVDLMSRWVSYELEGRRRTERLRAKNERLERFASIVSHDLRNPLTVADGSIELAAETGDAEHLERARRAIERMEHLVGDLLTLAQAGDRIEDPTPVALEPLVRRAWDGCGTAEATLAVESDPTVLADESRLRQLVENLVRNAVEHGGDDVTVRVGALPDGFFVADDGPGIPAAERDRVFEHGYSSKGGTGLGLAIVAEVVDAHGWDVTVREGAAGGARFEVTGVDAADD